MIAIRNRLYSTLLGGSIGLPKCNLIFNWKTGYDEKVAGNTPKVLYPCFYTPGTESTSTNPTNGINIAGSLISSGENLYLSFKIRILSDKLYVLWRGNSGGAAKLGWSLSFHSNSLRFRIADGTNKKEILHPINIGTLYDVDIIVDRNTDQMIFRLNNINKTTGISQIGIYTGSYDIRIGATYDSSYYPRTEGVPAMELYDLIINEYHFPLTGHAYGFDADGNSIEGTLSDDNCFTGLCDYNPEEGYNNAPDGNNNLVIPQSHTDSTKDVLGADLVDFLGGKAIAPYCKVDFEQVEDLGSNLVNKVDEDFDATKIITLNANLTSGNTYKVSYEMREAGTALEVSGDLTTTNIDFSLGWHAVEISAVNTGNSVTFTMTGGKIRNLSIQEVLSADNEPTNIAPFKRVNPDYNNLDNLTYEGFDPANVYRWNATELMRGVEWIKSLQPNWHIFMKIRDLDKVPLQIVAYKLPEIDYTQRLKVLKATKDKVTDVTDYALYINGNSAMLNQNGVPAEVGDTVSKIHSISNELIVSQTDETRQMTLTEVGLKGIYPDSYDARTYYITAHRMKDSDYIYIKFKTSDNVTDIQSLFGVCGSSYPTQSYLAMFSENTFRICIRNLQINVYNESLLQSTIYELEIFKVSNTSWTVKFGEENNMITYDGLDFSGGDDPINLDMILGAYNRNGTIKNSFDGEIIEFKLKEGE